MNRTLRYTAAELSRSQVTAIYELTNRWDHSAWWSLRWRICFACVFAFVATLVHRALAVVGLA
jgi:hypothetical protein